MTNIPTNKDAQIILSEITEEETIPKALALKAMDVYGRQCYENRGTISYNKYKKSLGVNAVCVCEYPVIKMKTTPTCLICGKKVDEEWLSPKEKTKA